jgi:hypothetical protein
LGFLDPVSWRFYLPAYIRYGLRHRDPDTSIYALGPAGIRQHQRTTEERFDALDLGQVRAVCAFLAFASQNGEWCDDTFAREALDDYWRARASG